MLRSDIINHLISKNNYKTYVEIGVNDADCFRRISIPSKIGVDPNPSAAMVTHHMTSDQFFAQNNQKFDIIFIDGLHMEFQVDKDVLNSLNCLSDSGSIVVHDCNPPTLDFAGESQCGNWQWNGTVWRSIVKLRCTCPNISISVVETDWGCGIIKAGTQTLYTAAPLEKCLTWEYFDVNRREILNLISVRDFVKKYLL